MPKPSEHDAYSIRRTGRSFITLHQWLDEEYQLPPHERKRHDITQLPVTMKLAQEKFGDEAVTEVLYHIKEDYEQNPAVKLMQKLSSAKRTILSPLKSTMR